MASSVASGARAPARSRPRCRRTTGAATAPRSPEVGLGGFQPVQHRLALVGRAPAHRAHRGEGRHQLRPVAGAGAGRPGRPARSRPGASRGALAATSSARSASVTPGRAGGRAPWPGRSGVITVEVGRQQRDDRRPHGVVEAHAVQQHDGSAWSSRRAHCSVDSGASRCCGRPWAAAASAITISSGCGASAIRTSIVWWCERMVASVMCLSGMSNTTPAGRASRPRAAAWWRWPPCGSGHRT